MIKEFAEAWNQNKGSLENYFRNTEQSKYDNYLSILKKIIELVINPYLIDCDNFRLYDGLNAEKITEIDNGNYQGTKLYIIPLDTYQPSIDNYLLTYVEYGSCSACDTLQKIQMETFYSNEYEYGTKPNKQQVEDYMKLALNLVQRLKFLI